MLSNSTVLVISLPLISISFILIFNPLFVFGSPIDSENATLSIITHVYNHELNESQALKADNFTLNVQSIGTQSLLLNASETPTKVSLKPGIYSVTVNNKPNFLWTISRSL